MQPRPPGVPGVHSGVIFLSLQSDPNTRVHICAERLLSDQHRHRTARAREVQDQFLVQEMRVLQGPAAQRL